MSRILIADDDLTSLTLLKSTLSRSGHQVVSVADGDQAWQALQQPDAPRLVILDWRMPGPDGPEICRRIRARQGQDYTFIILLTGRDGSENVVTGMNAGADDYMVKPFNPDELRARLRAGERILSLESKLQQAREELLRQSRSDPLTGIFNRRAILKALEQELARATRRQIPFCLAMLDLDHFKQINDRYGHLAGDRVLCTTTQRAIQALRNYDLIGRFGGEEFLLLFPDCDLTAGKLVAERVRQSIARTPIRYQQHDIPVTISLGIVGWQPEETLNQLIGRADTALYAAKDSGRNRICTAGCAPTIMMATAAPSPTDLTPTRHGS